MLIGTARVKANNQVAAKTHINRKIPDDHGETRWDKKHMHRMTNGNDKTEIVRIITRTEDKKRSQQKFMINKTDKTDMWTNWYGNGPTEKEKTKQTN